jgi:hypothetical protein
MTFASEVAEALREIQSMLIFKNQKYGKSALEPLGVFSQLSPREGLLIRIDDKLKRIKNGSLANDDEDVVNDLIGYLVLLKIHAIGFIVSHLIHQKISRATIMPKPIIMPMASPFFIRKVKARFSALKNNFAF